MGYASEASNKLAPVLSGFYPRVRRSNKNTRKWKAVNSLGHLINEFEFGLIDDPLLFVTGHW